MGGGNGVWKRGHPELGDFFFSRHPLHHTSRAPPCCVLSPKNNSPSSVAVGTAIADRPPHRSVRAALPHTALTLDDGVEACFTSRTLRNPWDTDFPALCRARVEFPQRSPWSALFPSPPFIANI